MLKNKKKYFYQYCAVILNPPQFHISGSITTDKQISTEEGLRVVYGVIARDNKVELEKVMLLSLNLLNPRGLE